MSDDRDELSDSEPVVQTRYASSESASETVVRALATATGVDPTELPLLYESVNPEALDALLSDPVLGENSPTIVEFVASGHQVIVSSDGQVTILDDTDG